MPPKLTEAQQKAAEERKAIADALKIDYRKAAKNPALVDILAKAKLFADMATKAATDGVAYDAKGNEIEIGPDKTARLLGEAAGLHKLIAYVERQMTPPTPKPSQDS